MAKSISSRVLLSLAVFGIVSTFVHGSSYIPKGSWPYSLYTTTQPPPGLYTTTTTTTTAPPSSSSDIQDGNNIDKFIIVQDPKTGYVAYIPSDLFWQKFGNSIRQKRSASHRRFRAYHHMQHPRIPLDQVPQIDDIIENDEYDQMIRYSDYLRSASQYEPQIHYDDNIADSAEDQHVQIQVHHHKNVPTWQPSDVFKAFFPNYRYNPNKIIYTYSSLCSNGCMNNKKYYNPPADNIVSSSSTTSTTEAPTTPTTTTTSETPTEFEDIGTTENTSAPETTTITSQTPPDYDDTHSQVPPA